ncbi:hypothetical protein G9A89_014923 [Geosiphon pyriformis]|nr:hypothetical protein G9A89_014923 [Geosiphon pyriformis]
MEDERPIGPQIGKSPGNFFQTDVDLKTQQRRAAKRGNKAGESGFSARKINLLSGKTVKIFKGHTGPVTSLDIWYHEGEEYLITGSWDKTLKKWNTKTKNSLHTFTSHTDFVKSVVVSQTKSILYSGSSDRNILSWDLRTGELLPVTMKGHTMGVEDLVFNETEDFLYSASSDRHIRKWNPTTGECLHVFEDHLTSVYFIRVSDDEMWSASADKTVKRWDLETGNVDTTFTHPDFVKCLAVFGSYLFTGGRDETIRVFDIGTGTMIREIEGHFDEVSCMVLQGTTLYTGSLDGTIRRWLISDLINAGKETEAVKTLSPNLDKFEGLMTAEEEQELAELMGSDDF